jgi:acetolactate synthase I/II/III large subunit
LVARRGIGAKLAAPDKLVVSVIGDEAFAETAMDLETAVRAEIPFLVVMKNNKGFDDQDGGISPRLAELRFREVADHSGMARALGVESERVEDPGRLRPALEQAIECVQYGKPAMVEVFTRRVPTSLYRLWDKPA